MQPVKALSSIDVKAISVSALQRPKDYLAFVIQCRPELF
jgi:hypothetical protein